MAKTPLIRLLAATLALSGSPAWSCGGWDEEPAPLLSTYLDRLPAKSFGTIFLETRAATPPRKAVDLTALTASFSSHPRAEWLRRIDEALAFARENYTDAEDCNWWHDARDAVASKGSDEEVAAYLGWRNDHGFWFVLDKPRENGDEAPKRDLPAALKDIDEHLAKATPAMQPQWIYARAAVQFRAGDRVQCQQEFDRVWQKSPDHPRAEAALFMSGRCLLSQFRAPTWDYEMKPTAAAQKANEEEQKKKRQLTGPEAEKRFQEYLTRYPSGRFIADAHGWLGALAVQKQDNLGALRHYIQQLETPGHPEVAKSALFMCEDALNLSADNDAVFAEIAQHPIIAMGATYLVLNQHGALTDAEAQQFNELNNQTMQERVESSSAKRWRQIVLPKLAAQVVAQKSRYESAAWTPRYLAILAQAASAAGNQEQAIELTQIPTASLDGSDDLLLARAISFQRAGRVSEALETFRTLLQRFPKSELALGARLKYAIALQDHHQAGEAVAMLKKLLPDPSTTRSFADDVYPPAYRALTFARSFKKEDISGAEVDQITQIIAAQENFAPLPELAAVLARADLDPVVKSELRAIIGQRYLAQEDFAAAAQFLSPAQLALNTGPLPELMKTLAAAKSPRAKAKAENALGDAWAALRGQILQLPAITSATRQDLLRTRDNGQSLGFKNTSEALEERDELRHASRWWMRAAREQPGTALAATARWKALDAIPQLASASDFGYLRAIETNAAATSRQLYDRLRKESPKSREARDFAAYWSFPVQTKQRADFPFLVLERDDDSGRDAIGQMGWTAFDYGAFGITRIYLAEENESFDAHPREWDAIKARITPLADHAATSTPAQLLAEVDTLQKDVRGLYSGPEEARYLNLLDDLALFLRTPQLAPATVRAYVELRLLFNRFLPAPSPDQPSEDRNFARESRIQALLSSPDLESAGDFVEFIAADRRGNRATLPITAEPDKGGQPETYQIKDYRALAQEMGAFRQAHPHSPKQESALFVQIRATHWLATPIHSIRSIPLPTAAPPSDPTPAFRSELHTAWRVPFDPKPLRRLLAAYDREFPAGRYAADIQNFRGDLAWRTHDWPRALDLTQQTLDDAQHPDLQPEAAERLANVFAELARAEHRSALLTAIRARPLALQRLQQYLAKTWEKPDHPLRYLGQYLADQLKITYSEPPPAT